MAAYRGANFIGEQIESILLQFGPSDELIIVDDASPDETVARVLEFEDPRITLIRAPRNQGYVKSFEQAVLASSGEYIFLVDQDDIWIPGRLDIMIFALTEFDVVASNFDILGGGSRGKVGILKAADSKHWLRNILGILVGYRPYYGCGMAMTRNMAATFTPVPTYLNESHDLWLALCGNARKSIVHLEAPTLHRRLHSENVTPRGWRSVGQIVKARVMITRLIVEAVRRS